MWPRSAHIHRRGRLTVCPSVWWITKTYVTCFSLLDEMDDVFVACFLPWRIVNTLDEYMAEGFITLRSDVRLAQIYEANALAHAARGGLS